MGWESIAESFLRDVRYGVRMLARNPWFSLVAVFALALGIGVNTAVFTAHKAMVARPLDARAPGEMVNLALTRQSGATTFLFSHPDYEAYRDGVHAFSGLIAFSLERLTLSNAGGIVSQRASAADSQLGRLGVIAAGVGNAEFASTLVVSDNYFTVLGIAPLRGRTFDALSASERLASPSVLISENYWQKRFAGDPAVVGRTVHLNGAAVTIVGITPHDFHGTGMAVPDFWLPISIEPLVHPGDHRLFDRENLRWRLAARLAPGVAQAQAQAEMTAFTDHLRALHDPHGESAAPGAIIVWPGSPFPLPLNQYSGLTLTILLIRIAAAMVLVVACGNVGSLQLARARSRQSELLTRHALGASRGRVIRQLLTESALLGLLAGAAALVLSWGLLRVLVVLVAGAIPSEFGTLVFDVTPDFGIFAFASAISLAAGVLFGLAPALESSRSASGSSVRSATASARSRRIQDWLVASQVALSLVLLIAGSLFIRSAIHALGTKTGYDSTQVVDLTVQFPEAASYTDGRKNALAGELRTRLAALPGVTAVSAGAPPDDSRFQTAAAALDGGASPGSHRPSILPYRYVDANYFQTLGVPMLLGRGFRPHAGAERSIVLSESAATQFWPGQNPVGRSLRLGPVDEQSHNTRVVSADGPAYQIIGVVHDTRGFQFDGSGSAQIFLQLADEGLQSHPIMIRTRSDPEQLMRAIDSVVGRVDPDLVGTTATLDARLRQSGPFIVSSLSAIVASGVGLVGMLLALMGIHGTVSYIVVLRTREVGIRMAIGAQSRDILGLILRESVRPVLAGLGGGLVLALGGSYVLRGLLYGVRTVDGVSFVGVSVLFLFIALVAAYGPSRRALRVEPVVALRYE